MSDSGSAGTAAELTSVADIEASVLAGDDGARFILVAGRAIGEPVVQHGPFVMNSPEEIEQAMRDYRDNRLVREKAAFHAR